MTGVIAESEASKPTIVLAPSGFREDEDWDPLVARLERDGFRVIAADAPHQGLAFDTNVLLDLLRTLDGPVALVAHGYGGMLASNAACLTLGVQALVFVAALAPEKGETVDDLLHGYVEGPAASSAAGDPGWKLVPSWFVYGDADERIPPALLARLAERVGAVETVVVVGGGHDLMATCPDEVLRVIEMAVRATIAQVPDITPD